MRNYAPSCRPFNGEAGTGALKQCAALRHTVPYSSIKTKLGEIVKHSVVIKKLFAICLVVSALWLLNATSVLAQELVSAKVLSAEGPVEIRRPSGAQLRLEPVAFKPSDELRAGDTIVTGRKGRLVLGLSDGSQAVIAAQTTVVINDLSQSPRTLFHLLRGKTRVQIEKLGGKPNPYRVNTPTAVIAVRGTIFDVLVDDDQETQVFLHEGAVDVTNLRWPAQPIFLNAGQTIRISARRQLNNPSSFKAGRNDNNFKARGGERRSEENRRTASASSPANRGEASGDRRTRPDAGREQTSGFGRPNAQADRGGLSASGPRGDGGARGGGRKP
jgi:hypothetical protein